MSEELALVPRPANVSLGTINATTPQELVAAASDAATTLAQVIRKQKLYVNLQGKDFVKCEGWTTLATMLGVMPREVSVTESDGIFVSTVELVRMNDGAVLTRASAECGSDDEKDKHGNPTWASRPRYARRSMATTRATAKACRIAFSWVIALAGFEPTPAEEMEPVYDAKPASGPKPVATIPKAHVEAKQDTADGTGIGFVVDVKTVQGVTASTGKEWLFYAIRLDDGKEYQTWDKKLADMAQSLIGQPQKVRIPWTRTKKGGQGIDTIELYEDIPL